VHDTKSLGKPNGSRVMGDRVCGNILKKVRGGEGEAFSWTLKMGTYLSRGCNGEREGEGRPSALKT